MAAVEVSGAPGEVAINLGKLVDPAPTVTETLEKSLPAEDSAAKETPTVEKLDETSGSEGAPDQPVEEKANGAEETSIKGNGETAAEQVLPEETPAKESAEVKEETSEVAAAEVAEEPKDVFVVKESEPEVEPGTIVEAPPAKEDEPEASEEPSVEKLASVPAGENEKAPEVDGGKETAAEAAE